MRTALFVSPHLDDVAFSCGGALVELAAKNWRTILCTVFTQSVLQPKGFALACQTDKGLSAEVDYMSLRRAEDFEFARIANAAKVIHALFAEAPHRGYDSAPGLFAGIKDADQVWRFVADELNAIFDEHKPDLIFAPQGIGNHADHLQTIKAILANNFSVPILWYRDTPYAIRNQTVAFSDLLPANLIEKSFAISANSLEQKIAGCSAYATQIEFQFGGAQKLGETLRDFHWREAVRTNSDAKFAEVFLTGANDFEIEL